MEKVKIPLHNYDMANIFSVYDDDGILFFNFNNIINLEKDIDKTLYTEHFANLDDDWYSLSQKYYGTSRLWWTILVANDISNPFTEIEPGTVLKILKGAVVSEIVSQINTK
jgi:hypothetical protein